MSYLFTKSIKRVNTSVRRVVSAFLNNDFYASNCEQTIMNKQFPVNSSVFHVPPQVAPWAFDSDTMLDRSFESQQTMTRWRTGLPAKNRKENKCWCREDRKTRLPWRGSDSFLRETKTNAKRWTFRKTNQIAVEVDPLSSTARSNVELN